MVLTAYYLDEPSKVVDEATLNRLGVLHWNLDPTQPDSPELKRICDDRGYTYRDFVACLGLTFPSFQLAHLKSGDIG
jgi:hypothetical protein